MSSSQSTIKFPETVTSVRLDFIIALTPAIIWSVYRFKSIALILLSLSVLSAIIADIVMKLAVNKRFSAPSLYSVYLGAVFALTLFDTVSPKIAIVGGAVTVFIMHLMGGEGKCFVFAPFVARIIISTALPALFTVPDDLPAQIIYSGTLPDTSVFDSVLGTVNGAIGAVSALAVLLGAFYLILRRNTNRMSSVSFIISVFLLFFFFPVMEGRGMESALTEILLGEILFTFAFVMTDFSSSPRSTFVKSVYGIFCAALTFLLIRAGEALNSVYIATVTAGILSFFAEKVFFRIRYKKAKENGKAK